MNVIRDVRLHVSEPELIYDEITNSKVFLLALNKWNFSTELEHRSM